MSEAWNDSLQELLSEALLKAGSTHRKVRKEVTRSHARSYSRPEDWTFHGQVQLVYRRDNLEVLIGLFDTFNHIIEKGARRLLASTEPRDCPRSIEYVTGEHWLPEERFKMKMERPETQIELIAPLDLSMGQILHASPVICTAHLSHGGLSMLTLDETTLFEGNTPRELLHLPKGMDVLEGLTEECKRKIWGAVLIEQQSAPAA